MSKLVAFPASAVWKLALPLAAALTLSACSAELDPGYEDVFIPETHYDRYPIEVAKGTVRLRLATSSPRLSASQENALLRFSEEAQGAATGYVVISSPTGTRYGDSVAGTATALLTSQGVPAAAIRHTRYRGGRYDPVVVSYTRAFASVAECGDWSKSVTITGDNEPYPNFGCSQQHNIAALVANPYDVVMPRAQTAPDAMRRGQVINDYRAPKDTATPIDQAKTATVSTVQ